MDEENKSSETMVILGKKRKQPMSISDFKKCQKKNETRSSVLTVEIVNDTPKLLEENVQQNGPPSPGFSAEYAENIRRVKDSHMKICKELRIQSRDKSLLFNELTRSNYFVSSQKKKTLINKDGKRTVVKQETPKYPMRLTFFNGGTCHFPFCAWPRIFTARAQDIELGVLMYDNEFARSDEGVKLYFEMDYRSKDKAMDVETIMKHAYACQNVAKKYYDGNKKVDYSMWVLLSTPKPKYIKTEVHPVISMGCHIIFPNIVINCTQGAQLCQSANLNIESKFERTWGNENLVDCCYKSEVASLRPIYCRKLENCLACLNDDNMRLSCESCLGRGKIPSGSIYTPSYFIDTNGKNVYENLDEFRNYVSKNIVQVVSETSIIPENINMFTQGYKIPSNEPLYIPDNLRSPHKDDENKDFVYRKDRKSISYRKKERFETVTDIEIIRLITGLVKSFHPYYDNEQMILDKVVRNSNTFFIDMRGVGRCFCRVKDPEGSRHITNRIYFRICKKKHTITQYCYDNDCKQLLKNDTIKKRLTSSISGFVFTRIFSAGLGSDFSKNKTQSFRAVPKHDSMNKFLDNFGK